MSEIPPKCQKPEPKQPANVNTDQLHGGHSHRRLLESLTTATRDKLGALEQHVIKHSRNG